MKSLKLKKKITILGGVKRSGKSRFALKWANYLARDKKVLFLNWSSFSEKLISTLEEMGEIKNENLIIETNYDVFDIKTFIEIDSRLSIGDIDIIFFDDLHISIFDKFEIPQYDESFRILTSLLFLANEFNVKIILTSDLSVTFRILQTDNIDYILKQFQWFTRRPERIIQRSSQFLFLLRPYFHNHKTDKNGNSTQNLIELYSIKNNTMDSIIEFDNNKEKIYSSNQKEN